MASLASRCQQSALKQDPTSAVSSVTARRPSWRNLADAFSSQPSQQIVTFLEIFDDPSLTMGIFCFPSGASIPLHDHPGMNVLSRLLFGTMEVQSYDWVEQEASTSGRSAYSPPAMGSKRKAKLVAKQTLRAPDSGSLALYPSEGEW